MALLLTEFPFCGADFKNVSIVAHYIKERTKNAQFVIISLRNNMFELADRLVGIYKTDNATKSVAINPGGCLGSQPEHSMLYSLARLDMAMSPAGAQQRMLPVK